MARPMAPQQRPPASSAAKPPGMLPAAGIIGQPACSGAAGGRPRRSTCSGEGRDREIKVLTQHTGGAGGIVQTELQQCGPTPDIGRLKGKSVSAAAYRVIRLYDPLETRHRAAPRCIMTGADEKVAGRTSPSSASPLRRRLRDAKTRDFRAKSTSQNVT